MNLVEKQTKISDHKYGGLVMCVTSMIASLREYMLVCGSYTTPEHLAKSKLEMSKECFGNMRYLRLN